MIDFIQARTSAPLVKVNSTYMKLKSDRVNLVASASPGHRARYSTNWDRKGCPGSEIQMYYGCPCKVDGFRQSCLAGTVVFAVNILDRDKSQELKRVNPDRYNLSTNVKLIHILFNFRFFHHH